MVLRPAACAKAIAKSLSIVYNSRMAVTGLETDLQTFAELEYKVMVRKSQVLIVAPNGEMIGV